MPIIAVANRTSNGTLSAAELARRPFPQAVPAPGPAPAGRRQRNVGTWVMVGVPVVLGLLFVWQIAASVLHADIGLRSPVSISRVSLEADPLGSRVDLVLVDRIGRELPVNGSITIKLQEPDGTVWETTRAVVADDFVPLPSGGLLAGRVGYSVVVPTTAWPRAPRRGGAATVSVSVEPTGSAPFSTIAEERFP